ncbi:hypothetical protein [Streptomyces solicathayae]|uniref:Integrase n=1 Tax=Streptomyces solicathayae TaxID=3081768 RepID=A0ABZ0M3Z6_9ACTN|nr:hypothetical protein [Streptomyces sp. HUAS YS2]WOX26370.1 hypothetical protein R2D22_35365 [Streptomyces sp. HUAS YS2]
MRDIWETIVATGRRCSEVVGLRLDCIGRYRGLAMLWHDQTKVGNYNEGIRIPGTGFFSGGSQSGADCDPYGLGGRAGAALLLSSSVAA